MAERGSPVPPGHQLDFQQLLSEAQHRWLRPAEICEILSNYQKFHIAPEPPSKPPSGSLFLFDRKVLRYFRKDGHNWRKKKDGKTIKEAHEKLKVGSVDVLHCYYAHGEENENFQRRSYWMLEQEMTHIVFVHYLEVKGNKTSIGGIRETDSGTSSEKRSPMSFSFPTNNTHSGNTNSTSPTSTLSSLCEDADSDFAWSLATDVAFHLQTNAGVDAGDSHQASSRFQSYLEPTQMENCHVQDKTNDSRLSSSQHPSTTYLPYNISTLNNISPGHGEGSFAIQSQETLGLGSWEEVLRQSTTPEFQSGASYNSLSSSQPARPGTVNGQELLGELLSGESAMKQNPGYPLPIQSDWQNSFEVSPHSPGWSMAQTSDLEFAYDLGSSFAEQRSQISNLQNLHEPFSFDQQNEQFVNNNFEQPRDESHSKMNPMLENGMFMEGKNAYTLTVKKQLLGGEDGLKKVDSFSRWMTKELGEVTDLHVPPTSGISWSSVECGEVVDESSLSPSLSQEQLFSIIDFSPKWAYAGSETEVLITGIVLKNAEEVAKHNWSCMFGEVEVPVEVLADGILYCFCPPHVVGHVPFYVTRSNRLSCSEVREFEFREGSTQDEDVKDINSSATSKMHLHLRLERFLSLKSVSPSNDHHEGLAEKCDLINKIISMKEEEDYNQMLDPTSEQVLSQHEMMEKLLEKRMKEKLYSWLLHKVSESGKGPSVLDSEGQGLLHLAAALGYDWAIKPTVAAGVSINFRDANGWTALHWAASCGREETVAFLVSLGAAPGLLTDPSPEFPLGRAPADLASANGHKGISGFLAESSLTSYFLSLTVNDPKDDSTSEVPGGNVVQTVSERTATPVNDGDEPDVLSLKDSLTAVCNATQAADRIHQVFRMRSFQRKQQLTEFSNDELGLADEYALSLAAGMSRKPGPSDGQVNSAAVQIQKKYRGWKKRKEFLIIRQRIVKIQAHVRGHQVRKQYKAITWSVGILEKVILRWRRKGSGLRGFRPDALPKEPDHQGMPPKEDDYDFLKEGRKQTEERLQKALTRVKSMVQYPEARAQYRRLLNVVEGINETKVSDMAWNQTEDAVQGQDDLFDIDSLLDDDTFMSIAFE